MEELIETLLPRRREIYEIICDHKTISLDFLHRRFIQISPRLLRYDLEQLMKVGLIIKKGKTRGALYSIKV